MRIDSFLLVVLLALTCRSWAAASPVDSIFMSEGDYPALVKQVDGRIYASKQKTSSPYLRDLWSDSLSRHVDSIQTQAYSQDTLTTKALSHSIEASLWKPHSGKAMLWALLPGGGQIYNRKYWKLPIVWGAFMACFYSVSWNSRQYQDYHAAYRDIMSENTAQNTAWLVFAPAGAKAEDYAQYSSLKQTLKRGNDFYRRYRDLSIVVSVLVYGLSILDAYVDAELYTFDISPDLSLKVVPEVGMPKLGNPSFQLGVNCSLTF